MKSILLSLVLSTSFLGASESVNLKDAYEKYFQIGAAIPASRLSEAEQGILFDHFNTLTPENCMKPGPLHPKEDIFDFSQADALIDLAQSRGLTVNAHALIWHTQCPDWFFLDKGKTASRALVLQRMRTHIEKIAGHFSGKVASWDVVNEAISDGPEYLRKSKWLTTIGDDFIAEAFFAARRADPKAELYYNDYNIELPYKRDKAVRLLRELKQKNVPISGIGIQGHWELDHIPFNDIEKAIVAFSAQGVKVMITELDIDVVPRKTNGADAGATEANSFDPYPKNLPADVQKRLADQYAQLFALFAKYRAVIPRVTFWGLHDGRSWLNGWPSKRTNHPLLWDRQQQGKPALKSVLSVADKNK